MGIREKLNENPAVAIGIVAVIVLVALVLIIRQVAGPGPTLQVEQAFFTIDDGETVFRADANLIPPFEHQGQQAYRARVYTCDGGRTQFVGFLERYTPEARAALEQQREARAQMMEQVDPDVEAREVPMYEIMAGADGINARGLQLKRPGDDEWATGWDSPAAQEIRRVECPDGTRQNLARVEP